MKWTTENPTLETAKAGEFYWFKGAIGNEPQVRVFKAPTVVELVGKFNTLYARLLEDAWNPMVESSVGHWAGPIEPPAD